MIYDVAHNKSGLPSVLIAQFLSAMADNTLLFAAIALLKATGAPEWHTPLLQEAFLLAYIVLAPFVGHIADSFSKARVMLVSNGLKLAGAGAMLAGLHPLLAYALVGVGAAAYSPAKYAILGELVDSTKLVRANGLLEGSTIAAILIGVVLGGYLADQGAMLAVGVCAVTYVCAAIANLFIPVHQPAPAASKSLWLLLREFVGAIRALLGNSDGRFTLLGTSIFWGTGSTLRFLLVAWVPVALNIHNTAMPANLSGLVAVGIALGATCAARFVNLQQVNRTLPAGIAIGILIMVFAYTTNLYMVGALLALIGACGGFYVVPLNALLQERGHSSVGAGRAIAVQNFFENMVMLVMVGLYTGLMHAGLSPVVTATIFGGLVLAGISLLAFNRHHSQSPKSRQI